MSKKDKKGSINKIKYSKFIVFLVIVLNVWFANKVLNAFLVVGSEPTVLIGAWFAFTVGELFLLSGIKRKEIDKKDKSVEDEEDYRRRV